jgi:hypothetical protein
VVFVPASIDWNCRSIAFTVTALVVNALFAVNVALPARRKIARPLLSTVATAGLDDVHVNARPPIGLSS